MSLLEKMLSSGAVKSYTLEESTFFNENECISTNVPILNVAFSGTIDGGITPGLITLAGESKSFKTLLGLYCVKSFLDKKKDGVVLFYDSEFGSNPEYMKQYNIDTSRIVHIPIAHIEELKFDIVKRLDQIDKKDDVMIFIDSVGNLASKKEVEDAKNENSAADMSRAKALKSLFRIITPQLTIKKIPCIVINHVYKEMSAFPKDIVSGGNASIYASNTIFIIRKSQEKDGDELTGYKFTINIEKSRFVREKSKLPFYVKYDTGIAKWSGMLDLAMDLGIVIKPKAGWYVRADQPEGKKYREDDLRHNSDFWKACFEETNFAEKIKQRYSLQSEGGLIAFDKEETVNE